MAARNGLFEVVLYLEEQGADKDKATLVGETALYLAAGRNHFKVVQYLAENGAEVDKPRHDGSTPLCICK